MLNVKINFRTQITCKEMKIIIVIYAEMDLCAADWKWRDNFNLEMLI